MPPRKRNTSQSQRKRRPGSRSKGGSLDRERWAPEILKHFEVSQDDVDALRAFQSLSDAERVAEARAVVQRSVIDASERSDVRLAISIRESESLLPGYSTLDGPHRTAIEQMIAQMTAYIRDSSRRRPLNTLMLA